MLVDEHAHEFRDRDGRMRVVQLHGEFLVEQAHRQLLSAQDPEHVLNGAGYEEILLLEPQFLPA